MIDWKVVGEVAGGGYGINILVLVVLSVVAWIIGLIVQKTQGKGKETPKKG